MLGHVHKARQPLVATALRQIFAAQSHDNGRAVLADVAQRLQRAAPKVARLLVDAEDEFLAFLRSRATTGRSGARPTRWNGSTARSAGAPTWSASTRPGNAAEPISCATCSPACRARLTARWPRSRAPSSTRQTKTPHSCLTSVAVAGGLVGAPRASARQRLPDDGGWSQLARHGLLSV